MLRVNLQPKISLEVKEGIKLPYWLILITGIILGALVGGSYWSMITDLQTYEVEIKDLEFKLSDFQEVITNKEEAVRQKEYLQGKRDFVHGISNNQRQWTDFFDQLRERTPKDVWYTKFSGSRNGDYKVEGNTYTFSSVGFAMLQINSISHVSSVTLGQTAGNTKARGDNPLSSISKKFNLSGKMELLSEEDRKKAKEKKAAVPGRPGANPGAKPGAKPAG